MEFLQPSAEAQGADLAELNDSDREALVDHACTQLIHSRGLIGSLDKCEKKVRRLSAVGVDEIACLVDFGITEEIMFAGLERLASLQTIIQDC
jgi:hypothetical protein